MRYRLFDDTGLKVSEVGLGTWQLGSADWGVVEDEEALDILRASVEHGVNFIDTADVYGMGKSETLIGKFLRESREPLYVATKLGRRQDGENGWPQNFTLDAMRRHTQESLRRLGEDSIFLQQLHCIPTEELEKGEVFDHLETLKKEGLIQHWGVSVESVEEGLICLKHPGCLSLQVIYNIFRQKLTDELLPQAKDAGVTILARVPLASGLLSGKFTRETAFAESDHRRYNADGQAFNVGETFAGVPFERGVDLATRIKALLKPREGASMAQLALRWVLDHKEVTTVIPGATRRDQAVANAEASGLSRLDEDVHRQLRELYDQEIAGAVRGKY